MAGAHPIPSGPRLLLTTLRDTTWTPVREGEKRARQATRVVRGLIGEADMDRFTNMLHHISTGAATDPMRERRSCAGCAISATSTTTNFTRGSSPE